MFAFTLWLFHYVDVFKQANLVKSSRKWFEKRPASGA